MNSDTFLAKDGEILMSMDWIDFDYLQKEERKKRMCLLL
jgi:hypothetical protein